jgi:type I restriction-modification system DNA methylase subunit
LPSSLTEFEGDLRKLIAKFENDKAYYLSKNYSEAQARMDLIDPLFRALGWDVENQAGLPHHEREVLVEKGDIDTDGRPDYNFRINGRTKFFVEAKTPSEHLDETRHIIQAKRYAWNTKSVFFVILTDFEEFRFYDASIKPDERKPNEGLLLEFRYDGYLEAAEKLWEFSRERVAAGSLDAMLPRDRRTKRLRIPVDQAFLDEMTGWRAALARNIYKNNRSLSAKQLNEVVQRLLDRIVFVRIAEDRNIIRKYQLREAKEFWESRGGKFHIFEWLNDLFHRVNEDFNGEIFKPHLSEEIKIDSEVLAGIIDRLYPPKSPYRFDVIGVELLGSIYERYLGSTIRPKAKRVFIEEKPEVRKAGGVYYTPQYIVEYIVKNTVGKVIEGKTPKQIEKIRILDPACGSGSFLIGAFQYLIDYHVRYLVEHPKEAHVHPLFPDLMKGENGEPRLSVVRKARILRNNLFGVDIDPQAVEITMMSLYLKALEGEKSQLPPKQHLLPELKYNIICGNSLIGQNIYDQGTMFGDAERERINAFDWDSDASGFGQITKQGGFDCVIGNPPYVRIQHMKEWAPFEVEHYKEHYKSASSGNYDIYVVFVEKGLGVLKKGGRLGYILPHKFFNAKYGGPLRGVIAEGRHLSEIVHFGDQQVFEGATNYTCLLFLEKDGKNKFQFAKVNDLEAWRSEGKATEGVIPASRAIASEWNFAVGKVAALAEKLRNLPVKLDEVADIFVGLQTSADDVFILDLIEHRPKTLRLKSKALREDVILEKKLLFPLVSGTDVKRYDPLPERQFILFPYKVDGEAVELIDFKSISKKYPRTAGYLTANRRRLEGRENSRMRGPRWYGYIYLKNMARQSLAKLCVPRLVDRLHAAYDGSGTHYLDNVDVGGITLKPDHEDHGPQYLLALLNSSLFGWYFPLVSAPFRGGWMSANRQFLSQLPIRTIDFSDPADKARHDRMVGLVERMLELNKQKHPGKLAPSELEHLEREIAVTDAEIDNLVYDLYGITDEERKIIEGVSP